MFKKIIQFIKYHNAFTIGLILLFVMSGVIFASDTVRETVIGKAVVEQQGIDNSALLVSDLGNLDFGMTIVGVSEDDQNYYIGYTYHTLDIVENTWQKITRTETLTVSKSVLAGRDLGFYIAEELGEIVDSELAYLTEVQQKEDEKGQTFVQETTKYTGLIGMVLNPKTRELPGYEPVVKQPEPVAVVYQESQPAEVGPLEVFCNPDWVCSNWNPAPSFVISGQQFTQTRTCTDQNNCGTEQAKPEEEHIAIGTYQSASAGGGGGTECTPVYYYYDGDSDGYGYIQGSFQLTCVQPDGHVPNNNDCNDEDPNINPGVSEVCDDQIDNDCDGIIDNCVTETTPTTTPTTPPTTTPTTTPITTEVTTTPECQTQTFYLDADSDSYGDPTNSTSTCEQPTGYVIDNTDCNDSDSSVNPGATEVCDNIDNNCNQEIDENLFQQCGSTDIGICQFGTQTCQAGVWGECQGAVEPIEEICGDNLDNNCNGEIDEGCVIPEPESDTSTTTTEL